MKNFVINKIVKYIKKRKNCSNENEEIIKYGIGNLYLLLTKAVVLTIIAVLINIFVPYIVFIITFNIIRNVSFGLHTTKSWQCWTCSSVIFIGIPYLTSTITINNYIKIAITIICTIFISVNSPADTIKRPIISAKRRKIYKYMSITISIIYSLLGICIKNQLLANSFIFSILLQTIIISPITYKIFGLSYNNYKNYRKEDLYVS